MTNFLNQAGNKLAVTLALLLMLPAYTLLYIIKKLELVKFSYSVKHHYLKRLRQGKKINRTASAMG